MPLLSRFALHRVDLISMFGRGGGGGGGGGGCVRVKVGLSLPHLPELGTGGEHGGGKVVLRRPHSRRESRY